MPRDIELVKQELESSTTSIFITKWILEHTPYVFEDYETEYISWRHALSIRNYIALSVNERKHALMEGKIK